MRRRLSLDVVAVDPMPWRRLLVPVGVCLIPLVVAAACRSAWEPIAVLAT